MVLDQRTFCSSNTCRPKDLPKELEGFLLSREVEGCSPLTLKTYRFRIGHFFLFLDGQVAGIQDISHTDIDRYLLHFRELGRSPHYIHSHFRGLRTFFNWCVAEEFVRRSPMRNMKPPKLPRKGKPFISQAERDYLLHFCPASTFMGARTAATISLFWSTGMRSQELANLQLSDLDWDKSCIRVFGKGSKERYVPFVKEAKKAVWRYLSYRNDDYPALWVTEERRPATKWAIVSATRRLIERAGLDIKDMHHIFRRSWAMRNLKAGVPIKYVQLIGGWESVTTLEQYVRAMESEDALEANWV